MIGATRRSNGFPVAHAPSTTKQARTAEVDQSKVPTTSLSEATAGAVQSLSNNPSLRAFRGESGFDAAPGQDPLTVKVSGPQGQDTRGLEQAMILASLKRRKDDDSQLELLKSRIASLMVALGSDGPLPGHGSQTQKAQSAAAKSAVSRPPAPGGTGAPSPPVGAKEGPKSAQPVQPSGPVDPMERLLQVLTGLLQALENAKGA